MQNISIPQITENLQKLSTDKLVVVYDFVSYLTERTKGQEQQMSKSPAVVLLSSAEYKQLLRYKRLFEFNEFTRQFGQEVEKRGLTEEELINDLEEAKREVFEEQYVQLG